MEHDAVIRSMLERNRRVEAEKAWEGSITRRAFIATLTYCTAAAFLATSGAKTPLVAAIFPPLGYLLSTLSLPWIKRRWLAKHQAKTLA